MARLPVAAVVLVAVALAVAGCLRPDAPAEGPGAGTHAGNEEPLRFIALGDMGMGNEDQARVAQAIATVCAERGCDFAVGLGDLIYPAGASSPRDEQFETKFEEPYAALDFPFWMVLGNHDNGQDPAGATARAGGLGLWYSAGDNEVAYAQRTDRTSEKWTMPARHYAFDEGPVHFIGLDTNTLLFYGAPVPPDLELAIQEQEEWLPGAVSGGEGPWRIAMGHHPYVSNGEHGNAGEFDNELVPGQNGDHLKAVFEEHLCDRIDLYLAGHDHDLMWLEPVDSCGRTQFIVSGGGGAGLYDLTGSGPACYEAMSLGFWWLEVQGDTLHAIAFDDTAKLLFEQSVSKPIA